MQQSTLSIALEYNGTLCSTKDTKTGRCYKTDGDCIGIHFAVISQLITRGILNIT